MSLVNSPESHDNKDEFRKYAHESLSTINEHRNKLGKFSLVNIAKNLKDGVSWDATTSMRRILREGRERFNLTEDQINLEENDTLEDDDTNQHTF